MEQQQIIEILERAIGDTRKIHLQMNDTPDDKFILFHPHVLALDLIDNKMECFGIIETHYAHEDKNYNKNPAIRGIKTVAILDDVFIPDYVLADEFAYNNKRPKDVSVMVERPE